MLKINLMENKRDIEEKLENSLDIPVELGKKLYKIELTRAEMYDFRNIDNIAHHILYDSETRVAIDITAEVNQAPLLSHVEPYNVLPDEGVSVLEKYLTGELKPVKNWHEEGNWIPCVTDIKVYALEDIKYKPIKAAMCEMYEASKNLECSVKYIREKCLKAELVKPQQKEDFGGAN